ncbi:MULTISPECIES: excinuclease ABC subunit UvrC [unclassified Facklamia]|uniref:excinuclease ABC subunit UvrC n=1 Tax=Aerococcaceae TaxID=186827 RepID=UPI0013BB29CF|nr:MULTISPECIES: excinuclease ABC subunit UvrC [unclassified Facklamia]NEW64347.1 excinuclease ABC subunit UvrC [Facklamia sp. 252]NEW67816.1 excinuclease ABC subunit UvrC [Facklamia sp. 253]
MEMRNTIREQIEQKLALLPDLPGCYLMKNADNQIIYVGKAKNLKNRVRSYFRGAHDTKTTKLVSEIHHFETIITNSNKEALILEINLIQQYKPIYNIRLKEGTMYPYLKITNERHPQLIISNIVGKDGAHYFGPFPNVGAATQTQQLLHRVYPLRRCNKNEKRACFYYHLGQCIGPCDHEVSREEYQQQIQRIKQFFNGNVSDIKQALKQKMNDAAEKLEFEQAADYRNQLQYIETTIEKQTVMSQDYDNTDVFGYTYDKGWLSIQVFMLRQGSILKREAAIYPTLNEPEDEVTTFIARFYLEQTQMKPKAILVPSDIDKETLQELLSVEIHTPVRGKKRSMLELCEKNSKIALDEKFRLVEMQTLKTTGAVEALAKALHIPQAYTIEAFDHSNILGTNAVTGMVVYKDGKPDRKNYRKYKIKTVEGSNEFASTQEVIRRRYTRLLRENSPLPDLILMDGGKIQIRAARDVIENELGLAIPVAGMVKNDKHKTAALMDGYSEELVDIDPRSQLFHFLQRVQEEVHRYAISYHRQVRSKNQLGSQLDVIAGVGPATRQKLLKHFKSLDRIRDAAIEDIKQLGIPLKTAERIKETLATYQQTAQSETN